MSNSLTHDSQPLVSVLLPVYNVAPYLTACVESLRKQTYRNIEIVLVDDGSTDGSGTRCDELAAADSRVTVVHQPNSGVAKARLTAFEHSHGQLVTFVDADDYVDERYVELLLRPILTDGADVVGCQVYRVRGEQKSIEPHRGIGLFSREAIDETIATRFFCDGSTNTYYFPVYLASKMVKREFVGDALRAGEGLWFGEDQVGNFHMMMRIKCLCMLPDALYYYVQYPTQATQTYKESLWLSIANMMERYEQLDTKHMAAQGIRKRTWIYIKKTFLKKMPTVSLSYSEFCRHLKTMRHQDFMQRFFTQRSVAFDWKNNLLYIAFRSEFYPLLYIIWKILREKKE